MGFCLKNYSSKIRLTTICLSIMAFAVSCSLPEEEVNTTLTPDSADAVEKAQNHELNQIVINTDSFKKGKAVVYQYNFRVDMSPVYKYAEQFREVIDSSISDDKTELKVAFFEQILDYDIKGNVTNDKSFNPEPWYIKLDTAMSAQNFSKLISPFGKKLLLEKFDDEDPPKEEITAHFYNFSSESITMDPPAAVKNRPDCGGLSPCQMKGTKLNFILEFKSNGVRIFISEITQVISRHVPLVYFFDKATTYDTYPNLFYYDLPMVSECWTYAQEKSLISNCKVLKDFQH